MSVALSAFVQSHFLAIWFCAFIAIALPTLIGLYKAGATLFDSTRPFGFDRSDILPSFLFVAFLVLYLWVIFLAEDFAYWDESPYLVTTLVGKALRPPIWIDNHRFWPLGHQEFNLLGRFTRSPVGYHLLPVLQLVLLIGAVLLLLRDLPLRYRLLVTVVLMVTPSFVISFFGLSYPERNVMFCLFLFLLFCSYYIHSRAPVHLGLVAIVLHIVLYYKEPVFLLAGGFVVARVTLKGRPSSTASWSARNYLEDNLLELVVLSLAGVFLALYLATYLPYGVTASQSVWIGSSIPLTLLEFLRFDPLLALFLLTLCARAVSVARGKVRPDLFWDPLAVGAALYFMSYIGLKIFQNWYAAPVDLIAILYLSRLWYRSLQRRKPISSMVLALVCLVIVGRGAAYSVFHVVERKNMIIGKVELVDFLRSYSLANERLQISAFVPYSDPSGFSLMELGAFLQYKGIQIAKQPSPGRVNDLTLVLKRPYPSEGEDRCFNYQDDIHCFFQRDATPQDVIMILPDDWIADEDFAEILRQSEVLFHHHPFMVFAKKMLPTLLFEPVPENWMHLVVLRKSGGSAGAEARRKGPATPGSHGAMSFATKSMSLVSRASGRRGVRCAWSASLPRRSIVRRPTLNLPVQHLLDRRSARDEIDAGMDVSEVPRRVGERPAPSREHERVNDRGAESLAKQVGDGLAETGVHHRGGGANDR
jgi:hypothetical protein